MMDDFQVQCVDKPGDSVWNAVGGGIRDYNRRHAGDGQDRLLCFILSAPGGEITGGIIGETHWDWFYINLLWVRDDLRGRGHGRRLLDAAEQEARRRGAKHAYLDTFSFQAPGFYEKQGYHVFGELRDFPVGHQRYYLVKEL